MKINKYPDQSTYISVNPNTVADEYIVNQTFRINNYEDLWHLNQFVDACNSLYFSPYLTIPCLIDAQADRRFNKGESFGLKLVCEFLNRMNANFSIFHPHNPEIVTAIMNNVEIIDNSKFINEVLEEVSNLREGDGMYNQDNLILMSSDAGGFKPLIKLCDKIEWKGETYSAAKARSWDEINGKSIFTQQIDRQDFGGKDILIIDDISIYGGTFKGLSKLLRERNCGKLYLAVSHVTVQNLGEDPVTNYFDKVFTTNSKFDSYYYPGKEYGVIPENLEIIKMF